MLASDLFYSDPGRRTAPSVVSKKTTAAVRRSVSGGYFFKKVKFQNENYAGRIWNLEILPASEKGTRCWEVPATFHIQ